jgi:hypothetical protein
MESAERRELSAYVLCGAFSSSHLAHSCVDSVNQVRGGLDACR